MNHYMPKTEVRGRRKLEVNKNFSPLANKLIVRTIYDGLAYRQYAINQRNKIMARAIYDVLQQTKPEVSSKDEKVNNKEVEKAEIRREIAKSLASFTTKTTVKPPNNPNREM